MPEVSRWRRELILGERTPSEVVLCMVTNANSLLLDGGLHVDMKYPCSICRSGEECFNDGTFMNTCVPLLVICRTHSPIENSGFIVTRFRGCDPCEGVPVVVMCRARFFECFWSSIISMLGDASVLLHSGGSILSRKCSQRFLIFPSFSLAVYQAEEEKKQ